MTEINGTKILYIEDNIEISELYKMRMEMEGYEVTVCNNSEKAAVAAKETKPNLILLDLMMPHIDGYTLLNEFRADANFNDTKIIVLSAIGEKSEKSKVRDLGADGFITKSQMSINEIINYIKKILDS